MAMNDSRTRFLDAALHEFRARGYAATTVDDVCTAAGLTKGSFFHHFASKEALALAAADRFAERADAAFAAAPYQAAADPLDRLLGYVDFRVAILRGDLPDYTCFFGTMVQETYDSHPAIRAACDLHLRAHVDAVARDVAAAKARYAPDAPWTAESLATFMQSVLQGAFVLAKSRGGPEVAADCLRHLRRYLLTQFKESNRWASRRLRRSSGSTTTPKRRSPSTPPSSPTRRS